MTEDDLETITPEVVSNNQLITIIRESKLEPNLAEEFKINFEEHFRLASHWAKKATKIIVTNENQMAEMQEARTARLFLREKRLEIEKFRVAKKEYYLNAGRAIDKVATFLKNMIEPTEAHLDRQEHFVEYKKKAEDERILAEAYAKQETERIAKEESDRKALAIAQAENLRLRDEQEKLKKENEAKIAQERAEQQKQLALVQAEREKAEAELRAKKQAEMKAEADRIREEERLKKAGDNDHMIILKNYLEKTPWPQVRSFENKRMIEDAKSHVYLAINGLKIQLEEEI